METALLGLVSALSWGIHDFAARYAGRSVGYVNAVLGTTLAGLFWLGLLLVVSGGIAMPSADGLVFLVVTGAGFALATMWLFAALTLAPIATVAPIVGAYPLPAVLIAIALGARPTPLEWLAMAAVIAGVAIVARAGGGTDLSEDSGARYTKGLAYAAIACLAFGVSITAGQLSSRYYSEIEVTFFARIAGLVAILPFYARPAARIPVPPRWVAGLAIMGGLDALALTSLVAAGKAPGAEIAIVLSSAFGAVTVILGWLVLKERIAAMQWLGIALVFAGGAALSLM